MVEKNKTPNKEIIKTIGRHLKGILSAPKNLIYQKLGIPLKPRWVVLMATDMCNSRCSHCNIWKQKSTPIEGHLTPEELEKTFSDKVFENVEYILCTGGEATLRKDFKEMVSAMHKALPKATIQLSTNAILPERALDVARFAMGNNIKFDVGVSLDGVDESHDKIRGIPGNFKKADWLLHKLIELREEYGIDKLHVGAGIVVSDLTLDSVYKTREYATKLNIDFVEAWYNTSSFYDNYEKGDRVKIREKIIKIVKSQSPGVVQEKWLQWLAGRPVKFPCFGINTFCVLKCNGDIVPCLNLWDMKIGNVKEVTPTEIWKSLDAKKARENIRKCEGCLNNWGAGWSFQSSYYPIMSFYLRHPRLSINRIFKK